MHRNPDRPGLIGNGSRNSLADPPGCIRTELKALGIVVFLNGFNKPQISFLNQIQKLHSAAHISLGNAYNQAQIRLSQTLFGIFIAHLHLFCQFYLLLR